MAASATSAEAMFQSAPPVKGAIASCKQLENTIPVSIRAPREGGDVAFQGVASGCRVSIRAPREGGDPTDAALRAVKRSFNPRPP